MGEFNRGVFTRLVDQSGVSKATREAIFELLAFAREKAWKVEGGKDNKNFHYVVRTRSSAALLFSCDSNGWVWMYLGNFPQLKETQMSSFLNNFRLNEAFKDIMRYEDPRNRNWGGSRGFDIAATLIDPVMMKQFKSAVLKLQDDIAKAGTDRFR